MDPPGLRFESLLALKMAETSVGIPFGAAKSRSRALFCAPNAKVDAHRVRSGALQEASRRSRRSKRPPGSHFGSIWQPFRNHFGPMLATLQEASREPFWIHSGPFRDSFLIHVVSFLDYAEQDAEDA